MRGMSLVVSGGIIEEISDIGEGEGGHDVMDFSGFTLSPPFCDYHLHFSKDKLPLSTKIGGTLLDHGIARVYEGGDGDLAGIEMKKKIGGMLDIRTSGFGLFSAGGYGRRIGREVNGLPSARLLIDELRAQGVEYLKVINSGLFRPESGKISAGGFERSELEEIIAYAASRGLPVFCHANGDRAIKDAVLAGASAIVHGFSVSDETLSLMAERGTDFIPTVNALFSLTKAHDAPEAKRRIEAMTEGHLAAIRKAHDKGITVLPGSDAGPSFITYGISYHEELTLFRRAGLSIEDVMSAAVNGPLRKGMKANYLVLRGLTVEKVFRDGKAFA
ncbi:MAG TPA: amidohydrolase family protein [Thermodesulfovibrionales bacterium]|nr:amidohydrolase family protein [Thermodesulfovibrionales bacterium]